MLSRPLLAFASVTALAALVTACPAAVDEPGDGKLVVGVQAEELAGRVGSVHLIAKIDGVTAEDRVTVGGAPHEIELQGRAGASVEVIVEALSGAAIGTGTVVTRHATTRLVASEGKKLLRLQLESRCAGDRAIGDPLGAVVPVVCPDAPRLTCVAGGCVSSEVDVAALEDYEPGWAAAPPDICRPRNRGAPEVILGQGQTDYAPLTEGQTLQLEKGPQGGHHIWIAVRMKNLRQSGSRTTITAKLVADPTSPIFPAGYVFTFDRDEGNYCKLYGLRLQLDSGAADLSQDYKRFLGKGLEVTAEVVDTTGARATATKTIQIADKLLCADGTTTSCNPT